MFRKLTRSVFFALVAMSLVLAACGGAPQPAATDAPPTSAPAETVTITLGSWRTDDAESWGRILDAFHAKYPNIIVKFDPTNPPDYNATLRTQLEGGTGPDVMYLRSFTTARELFDQGFLEPLDSLPGIHDNFTNDQLTPWATDDGKPYGIPLLAVSHGVYYNEKIFQEQGIEIPQTWEELMAASQKLQDAGITPFANASGEPWTMAEVVWMNIAPNYIGGVEGRMAYLNGERCFNDEHIVNTFGAIEDLAPYLPKGQEALSYQDSQQLFLQGEAAMFLDGSWTVGAFEADAPDFEWSVFAVPPPAGQPGFVSFHLDAGMGINAASKNKEAAKTFLQWLMTPEFGQLLGNELPGFFPIGKSAVTLSSPHADAFLKLNEGRGTDIRFVWQTLADVPAGQEAPYTIIQDDSIAITKGDLTPQAAADHLQTSLAAWYEPAKNCQ